MSIIKKQTISNTFIDYLGIALGFINMSLLFPHMLSTEELGLRGLIITIANLGANFSSLGATGLVTKFFPYFKSKNNNQQGFMNLIYTIPLIGLSIFTVFSIVFEPQISSFYESKSPLLGQYYLTALIATAAIVYSNIITSYFAIELKTIFPNFIKHIFLRLIWLIQVLLYYFDLIDFNVFVYSISLSFVLQTISLLTYGFYTQQIRINKQWPKISHKFKKIMIGFAFFSIAGGLLSIVVSSIDQLMIAGIIGTGAIAVYNIAQYLSNVIQVPGRSMILIATPIISHNLKNKNHTKIESIYKKSAINMGIASAFVFLLIWVNIDSYIHILPKEYDSLKLVFPFLGLGILFDMFTGVNAQIIGLSKYYRFSLLLSLILVIITISTNYIFIPIYGIMGAALATCITYFIYNLIRTIYLMIKMKLFPYDYKSLIKLVLCVLPPFVLSYFWVLNSGLEIDVSDKIHLPIVDLIANTVVYTAFFLTLLLAFKPSEEIHQIIIKHWNKWVVNRFN